MRDFISYPCFLDFEASSDGPNSYPIEVAWNDPDGTVHEFLINPESVTEWTDWSLESAAVHNIPMAELKASGLPAPEAAQRLRVALRGKTIVTDAPEWDGRWLRRLFVDTTVSMPDLQLANAQDIYLDHLIGVGIHRPNAIHYLERIHHQTRAQNPERHRAAIDVGYLMKIWEGVCAIPGRRGRRLR